MPCSSIRVLSSYNMLHLLWSVLLLFLITCHCCCVSRRSYTSVPSSLLLWSVSRNIINQPRLVGASSFFMLGTNSMKHMLDCWQTRPNTMRSLVISVHASSNARFTSDTERIVTLVFVIMLIRNRLRCLWSLICVGCDDNCFKCCILRVYCHLNSRSVDVSYINCSLELYVLREEELV